jgi:hypothetical protein
MPISAASGLPINAITRLSGIPLRPALRNRCSSASFAFVRPSRAAMGDRVAAAANPIYGPEWWNCCNEATRVWSSVLGTAKSTT